MIAAVFNGPNEMKVREVETPVAGPGEFLVEVGANTVCGTDLRILRGEKTTDIHPPSILGHEFAGRIADVGEGVEGYEVGSTVATSPIIPCRRCFYCKHDMENVCANWKARAYGGDGGLSQYVRIPAP